MRLAVWNFVLGTLLFSTTGIFAQTVAVQPTSMVFDAANNTFIPLPQTASVTVSGGNGLSLSASSNVTWLSVSPGGPVPNPTGTLSFSVSTNPTGLTNGSYTGQITFSMPPAASQALIVRLNVGPTGGTGQIQPSPTSLTFNIPPGSASQVSQTVQLGSITPVNFSATGVVTSPPGGFWLSVSPLAGTTPQALTVTASPSGLTPGNYQGTVVITSGGVTVATIPVALNFSAQSSITIQPDALTFNYQTSASPPPAQMIIASYPDFNAVALQTAAVTTSGGNWLQVSPGQITTPSGVGVSINSTVAAGLAPGAYTGTVTLSTSTAGADPFRIPVTLNVSSSPLLSVSSAPVVLAATTGSSSAVSQTLSIGSTGGAIPVTTTSTTTSGGGWLSVSLNNTSTPATATVTANPAGLPTGNYFGTITVGSTAPGNSSITIPVRLSLSSTGLLTTTPRELIFSKTGTATPPAQTFGIASSGGPVGYTITSQVLSPPNGNWIGVSPASGTTPGTPQVTIQPQAVANLPTGSYLALLTISSGIGDPIYMPVSLIVGGPGGSGPVVISPNTVTFNFQPGAASQTQTLQVTGTAGTSYTTTTTTGSGGNWLTVSPLSGQVGTPLQVTANPGSLQNGTYSGTVSVLPSGTTTPVQIQVTMNIGTSTGNALQVSPASLSFTGTPGGSNPTTQNVQVSAASPTNYTVTTTTTSGGSWLSAAPSNGTTPGTIAVAANIGGLGTGTYNGTVTLTPAGGTPTSVPVTLSVGSGSGGPIQASPSALVFAVPLVGANPGSQTVQLSAATPFSFTTSVTTASGGNWLQVTPLSGTTPSTLQAIVTSSSLSAGTYQGTILVTPTTGGAPSFTIPVTLTVGGANLSELSTIPTALTFTGATGGVGPTAQSLQVNAATPTGFAATVTTNAGGNWLSITPASGVTPIALQVAVNTAGLTAGTYTGSIRLAPNSGGAAAIVPVTLTLGSGTGGTLQVSPAQLSFSTPPGGPVPPSQQVQVTSSTAAVSYFVGASTDSGGGWLSIDQTSGSTPGTVVVSVNPTGLAAGTYRGSVNVSPAAGGTITTIPVTFTVGTGGSTGIQLSQSSVSFTALPGGANPTPVNVQLTAPAATGFSTTVTTSSGGNWLVVSPTSGTTPATLQLSANVTGLAAGTYSGSVAITPVGGSQVNLPVTLTIGQSGSTPVVSAVLNGASFLSSTNVAPGEIVSIFGSNLGPTAGLGLTLDSQGRVNTTAGNVRVLFDNVAAPLLFVRNDQINAVVPYALTGRATATVQVEVNSVRSVGTVVNVQPTAPGIFTLTAATPGSGQGAILNANGSVNSVGSPAARGSIVSVFLTGGGQTTPGGVDGEVASPANPKRPVAPIVVRVGGVAVPETDILYAGSAPGLVSGAMQVNLRLPTAIQPGERAIEITIGSGVTQAGVTVAVQ